MKLVVEMTSDEIVAAIKSWLEAKKGVVAEMVKIEIRHEQDTNGVRAKVELSGQISVPEGGPYR
jgi:uncharacterized protein YqgV (UPF0045/DUF77 family)